MTYIPFEQTQSGQLTSRILAEVRIAFSKCTDERRDQHIRNLFSIVTNVEGNLRVIHNNTGNVRANEDQLKESLDKMISIINFDDSWNRDCWKLYRENYNWAQVDKLLKRMIDINKPDQYRNYVNHYRVLFEKCIYTDQEVMELVTRYPYLADLYNGTDQTIKSVGTILR